MKRWNRILAALLAATMLYAAPVTPVLADEEIVLDDGGVILPAQGAEEEGLEIDPEALPELMPEEIGLDLDDDVALTGNLDLVGDGGAIVLPCEEELVGTEANDSSDFVIEDGVLVEYKGEGGDVVIPNSVTSIGEYAFKNCTSLTSVMIPNSVTCIGALAFYECTSLTSVTIPNSVTSIGGNAFSRCDSLTSVTIPNSVTNIGDGVFTECTSLTNVTIPNSVTSIGRIAFYNCTSLTSVKIPNSITSIAYGTFYNCTSLTSVTIPNSVTDIGAHAFRSCTSLISVTIPNSVSGIGEYAFMECTSLTSVTIPDSVTSIGAQAFRYCTSLTGVTIPKNVTSVEEAAFWECTSLTSVTIPNSVTQIGGSAFGKCKSLTSVKIPNSVTSIGDHAFFRCDRLASVTIPNRVTSIGNYAFYGCDSLTSVTIPNSVTSIEDGTFSYCPSLTSVTIPNSVTSIGAEAFRSCISLTSVTIPNSVTSIGERAFYYCSSLTSAIILSKKISFGENVFDDSPNVTMHIISDSDAIGWAKDNGVPYDIIKISSSLKLKIGETHTLTVNGFDNSQLTWSSSNKKVATVSEGKVKAVGAGECTVSTKIKDVGPLECKVTVTDPAKLSKTSLAMKIGESQALTVSGLLGRSVTWVSSNTKVATVSGGKVKAVGAGKCVISAKVENGKTLKCNVTVTDPAKLSKTSLVMKIGESQTLTVSGLLGRSVTWVSSNTKVATVSGGKVKAVGAGKCVISAKVENGKTLKCNVTVTDPAKLSKTSLVMKIGESETLTVSGLSGRSVTWSSSDNAVAKVSGGKVKAVGAGECVISAKVKNGKTLKCNVTVTDPVKLSKTSLVMKAGESETLTVSGLSGRSVTWSSSDNAVATVSGGKVKAVGEGECVISAKVENGKTLKCNVTVTDPVKLSKTSLVMKAGESETLTVSGLSGRSVTWSSSDNAVATVSGGKVKAVGEGECVISAKVENGKTLKCNVTVTDPVKLSKTSLVMKAGESETLTVSGLAGRSITWSSSDRTVATVSEGKVKAVGAGECVILAKVKNGKTLKCTVTVTDPAQLDKTVLSLKIGESETLTVSGLSGRSVTWSSSDNAVATVSGGKVKAVGAGKCTISAKVENSKTLTCKVTVSDPAKLSRTSLTISAVDSATVKLTGASGKKVTWISSKSGVVRIVKSDSGSVTVEGVKPGTAVIQAKIAGGQTLKCTVKVVAPIEMTMVKIVNESGKRILYTQLANRSSKKITHIKFDILQYDSRNQRLASPYGKEGFIFNQTINAHDSTTKRIDVNGQTDHVKYSIEQVRFSDGTTWKP